MNQTPLRVASLTFAVVVTGFLVARAAGCTSSKPALEPTSPTSTAPPTSPTAPGNPGSAGAPPFSAPSAPPGDAGPTLSISDTLGGPPFLPATKAAMPIFREPPPPAPQQQQQP